MAHYGLSSHGNKKNSLAGPIPEAARSKAWVCGHSFAGTAGSNPAGNTDVCRVFSCRGLCVGLITRPEESYRVCGVSERDREASIMRRHWPTRGCCAKGRGTNL